MQNKTVINADGASRERAFKRIPFGINFGDPSFPPSVLEPVLSSIGTKLCEGNFLEDDFQEGTVDCLAALPPNENPTLVGFNLFGEPLEFGVRTGDVADTGKNAVLSAARGSELVLEPVFTEDTVERYQVFSFDVENNDLIILNRYEDLALSWYTTAGDISPHSARSNLASPSLARGLFPRSKRRTRETS